MLRARSIIALLILLSAGTTTKAGLVITEIMANSNTDAGNWIEIYNDSSVASVDLGSAAVALPLAFALVVSCLRCRRVRPEFLPTIIVRWLFTAPEFDGPDAEGTSG